LYEHVYNKLEGINTVKSIHQHPGTVSYINPHPTGLHYFGSGLHIIHPLTELSAIIG